MQLAPNCAFKPYSRMDSIPFHFRTCSKNTLKVNGGGCSPKSNRPLCFSKYGLIPCILIGSSIDKHTEWPLPKKWFCWETEVLKHTLDSNNCTVKQSIGRWNSKLDQSPAFLTSDDFIRSNEIIRTKWPIYVVIGHFVLMI